MTGRLQGLPDDRCLQVAVPFGGLLHPALRMYVPMSDREVCEGRCIWSVYTAGLGCSNGVGAAFIEVKDNNVFVTRKFLLSKYCTERQASLLSVWKALDWLYKRFEGRMNENGDLVKVFVKMNCVKGMLFGTSFDQLVFKSQRIVHELFGRFGVRVAFECVGVTRDCDL